MSPRNPNRKSRGFTLLEVLLVILILGMLATVAVVALSSQRDAARVDTTKLLITSTLPGALDRFNNDIGRYPTTEEGLKALVEKPTLEDETQGAKWHGPYLTEVPKDTWNHDLHYEPQDATAAAGTAGTSAKGYKLWSDGPDGQTGTADDIKNWKDETAS